MAYLNMQYIENLKKWQRIDEFYRKEMMKSETTK